MTAGNWIRIIEIPPHHTQQRIQPRQQQQSIDILALEETDCLDSCSSLEAMTSKAAGEQGNPVEVDGDDEDELIDEEQLQEYTEMVDNLGEFPVGAVAART